MTEPWTVAERQIDALISSRAKANIEAAQDRAREQERQERIRAENLAAWAEKRVTASKAKAGATAG